MILLSWISLPTHVFLREALNQKHKLIPIPVSHLQISVGGSTEKDLGILCLGSGKVYLSTNLNKKGYIPGKNGKFQVSSTNSCCNANKFFVTL